MLYNYRVWYHLEPVCAGAFTNVKEQESNEFKMSGLLSRGSWQASSSSYLLTYFVE